MSGFIERRFLLIAVVMSAAALIFPQGFVWAKPCIRYLLGLIMFGMGVTLTPADFRQLWRKKAAVLLGVAAQYGCMPLIALGLGRVFSLDAPLVLGFVLLGACPGGTASNVIAYLARGNVALSVAMTLASTLMSPIMTPAIVYMLLGHSLHIPFLEIMYNIFMIILLPVAVGVLLRRGLERHKDVLLSVLPSVSIVAIAFTIAIVIALDRDLVLAFPAVILLVVILHNLSGMAAGYGIGLLFGFSVQDRRTMAIEVGMQNSGLGVALAAQFFSAQAALPSALFSLWHNMSGIVCASWWRRSTGSAAFPD